MKLNEFEKIARILAEEHKISVKDGDSWAANIKDHIVFYRKNDIYTLPEDHILGLTLHEIGHIHYTTEIATKDYPPDTKELTHTTINMLEDHAIEHIIGQDYTNAEEILETTRQEVLDKMLKILPKTKITDHEKALLFASARFENRGYTTNLSKYEKIGDEIAKIMTAKRNEILERKDTKSLLPIAKEIVDILIKELGKLTDQQKANIQASADAENAKGRTGQSEIKKKIIGKLKAGKGWQEGICQSQSVTFIDAIGDQAQMIGQKIRTILKRNNAMEFGGRFRTGKIITKRLTRMKIMKDRRPYARRIVKSNQSYAFAAASDVSGSMFGRTANSSPASYALSSLYMLGEALRIAGVPKSLIVFAGKAKTVGEMNKKQISFEELSEERTLQRVDSGGTCIHVAMDLCIEELKKVRAERKIMIILTDGQSSEELMKIKHQEAIKSGIEPLMIAITDDEDDYSTKIIKEIFSEKKTKVINGTGNKQLIGKAFIDILEESIRLSK